MKNRELRDKLGELLHRAAFFDNNKLWISDKNDDTVLSETSREEWRKIADRMIPIAAKIGLNIS